ncbi:hypothetical protein [Mycolicibacterium sp.]|uniref:hypothetical protein n=1 Tax=Mycolicibacterium sp. TaxID=2320850 RepID=UPI0037C723BC
MPIRPENRDRYPADWPAISNRIRFERAYWMCECRGQCGHDHHEDDRDAAFEGWLADANAEPVEGRCPATHLQPHPVTGSKVILTTAHLNHTPEDCRDDNLLAMCQRCHLAYDREIHARNRMTNRTTELEKQMTPLFLSAEDGTR